MVTEVKSYDKDICMENIQGRDVWRITDEIYYIKDKRIVVRCEKELLENINSIELLENDIVDRCIGIHDGVCYHDVLKAVESSGRNARFTILVDAPSQAKEELIYMLKEYFLARGIFDTRYICTFTEESLVDEKSPYDYYIYGDGLKLFRKKNWIYEQIEKNNKKIDILQIVDIENFESLYQEAVYVLNKYDERYVPKIHFMVVNDINSPTIPYMKYSRIINSLKSEFYNRISCCEYEFKEKDCSICGGKVFKECQGCFAYGFCAGVCELQGFTGIEYDNLIQKRICCAKKNIVKANLQLSLSHEGVLIEVSGNNVVCSRVDGTNKFMGEMVCWVQRMRESMVAVKK